MSIKREYKCHQLGDSCLIFVFFDSISEDNSQFILSLFRSLQNEKGFLDLVPAYCDIAIHFDPQVISEQEIRNKLDQYLQPFDTKTLAPVKSYRFPVVYEGQDLARVADLTKLSATEIIHRHSQAQYTVAMIGFLPHFPYLIGLDPSLHVPRLETPRERVPEGSVAIGGEQTGVYPEASPGGWNLIGRMNPEHLQLLEPRDKVEFFEVKNEDQL